VIWKRRGDEVWEGEGGKDVQLLKIDILMNDKYRRIRVY
jgi:hypothetical protein